VRSLSAGLLVGVASLSPAFAEDEVASSEPSGPEPVPLEVGIYTGGFISNYYHQFYQFDLFPGGEGAPDSREDLRKLNPLAGLRFAYFVKPWLGLEGELNMIMTETKVSKGAAKIYGGRLQVMFQYPDLSKYVVPYVAIGDGFDHVSSDPMVLGSDTDWPVHIGVGARFRVHPSITLRLDGRFLRAPSQQAPYHLNASLAEFMLGISWRPSRKPPEPPPPPPPPPKDSDADGIDDGDDKCPNEAEDKDLYDDSDGCPELDNDADGVPDGLDQCPLDAEDKDGFADEDGCADEDNDADGVPDKQDKCVAEPEDKDGFKDLDGCAEPDNDADGFTDAQDKCPNEAELINGIDDDDGCPDRGNALVVVSPDRLELLEAILFKKTVIQKESSNLLGQIGATMRAHPEILRLRITVHVQPTKNPDADQRLSETRAFAIREWLIKYGIEEKRLEPRGFGGTKPLVDPKEKGAAAINERIDLIILERK
jgi:outer membrane protein OmpA-like peptidoglycan-associated protein